MLQKPHRVIVASNFRSYIHCSKQCWVAPWTFPAFTASVFDKSILVFGDGDGELTVPALVLMYFYHIQNWLDLGNGQLIFLILVAFWLSKTGQNCGFWAFSWECMGGMAWDLTYWCNLIIFTFTDFGHGLVIFIILAAFWLGETGWNCSFQVFSGESLGGMAWVLTCWCILTTFRTD